MNRVKPSCAKRRPKPAPISIAPARPSIIEPPSPPKRAGMETVAAFVARGGRVQVLPAFGAGGRIDLPQTSHQADVRSRSARANARRKPPRSEAMRYVSDSIKAAAKQRGKFPTGAVVMYGNEFSGWMDRLRDPDHWMPGCVAVLDDGSAYVARGGTDYDGAKEWVPANT